MEWWKLEDLTVCRIIFKIIRADETCFYCSNLPKFGGYDQFGALLGQVFIENVDEPSDDKNDAKMDLLEFNLPGYRKRRVLPINRRQQIRRSASIIGVCFDGTVFEIGALSYYEKVTQ